MTTVHTVGYGLYALGRICSKASIACRSSALDVVAGVAELGIIVDGHDAGDVAEKSTPPAAHAGPGLRFTPHLTERLRLARDAAGNPAGDDDILRRLLALEPAPGCERRSAGAERTSPAMKTQVYRAVSCSSVT